MRFGLALFLGLQVVLLVWWIAFYPGLVSYDSVKYSWEVLTSNWSTDHSVLYDALVWLSYQVSGGVTLLTALQTTAYAAVLAFTADALVRLGVRRAWAAVAAGACVVLPSLGSFPVYVWKDVAFAAAEIWVLGLTLRLVASRRELGESWARTRRVRMQMAWLAFAFLLVALFRNNGFIVVVINGLVLVALFSGARRLTAAATGAAVVVFAVLTYGLFPNVGIKPAPSDLVLGTAYHDIAIAYHHDPGSFSQKQQQLMAKVAPLSLWYSAGGDCWSSDRLDNVKAFHRTAAADRARKLFGLWRRTLQAHPVTVVVGRLCRGAIAWSPWPGPAGRGNSAFPPLAVPDDMFGWWPKRLADSPEIHSALLPDPPISSLRSAAKSYVSNSMRIGGEWILWRGATWCYLAYIAVGVLAWRRRSWIVLSLAATAFANQVTVLLDNPAQLIRYMEGCIYLGILVLPLLTLTRRAAEQPAATAAPADER
jgi:hypothetical protein